MSKQQVLVAGATGSTGKIIIDILKTSKNYEPIAMVRKSCQKDYYEQEEVKTVFGDLENDLAHTVEHAEKVIFAAGSKGKNVKGIDQDGAKKLIDVSEEKGIHKFVMLSSMGADKPSVSKKLEAYLKAKQNADEYLKNSSLNYTIVRPGVLTDEDGTGKIDLKNKLNTFGKISRENVAKTLVKVLKDETKKKETIEILDGKTPIVDALG